jgi:hypothetical protein
VQGNEDGLRWYGTADAVTENNSTRWPRYQSTFRSCKKRLHRGRIQNTGRVTGKRLCLWLTRYAEHKMGLMFRPVSRSGSNWRKRNALLTVDHHECVPEDSDIGGGPCRQLVGISLCPALHTKNQYAVILVVLHVSAV